jgi:ketosteroid isomerase-like protein
MFRYRLSALVVITLLGSAPLAATDNETDHLRQQVEDTEKAFAATMARRDHAGFMKFLSSEAIFISGESALRGKEQVADAWAAYFSGPDAPFSWQPQTVEVLDSGTLALSSGPVKNSQGEVVATFNSIWRQEAPGEWRIVFDKGSRACQEPAVEN